MENFIKSKLFMVGAVGVVLLVVLYISNLLLSETKKSTFPLSSFPTPSPIYVDIRFDQSAFASQIDQGNQSVIPSFSLTFDKNIPVSEHSLVKVTLSPSADVTYTWNDANTQLTVTPQKKLNTNQTYSVSVSVPGLAPSVYKFTTPSSIPNSDQRKLQGLDDVNFANTQNQIQQQYPFINNLPYFPNQYNVYFDVNKKQFFIDIYVPANATASQISQQQQNALNALKNVVPNYSSYGPVTYSTNQQ